MGSYNAYNDNGLIKSISPALVRSPVGYKLSGSSGSYLLYKISGSDPDSAFSGSCVLIMASGPDESDELSMFNGHGDNGSMSFKIIRIDCAIGVFDAYFGT